MEQRRRVFGRWLLGQPRAAVSALLRVAFFSLVHHLRWKVAARNSLVPVLAAAFTTRGSRLVPLRAHVRGIGRGRLRGVAGVLVEPGGQLRDLLLLTGNDRPQILDVCRKGFAARATGYGCAHTQNRRYAIPEDSDHLNAYILRSTMSGCVEDWRAPRAASRAAQRSEHSKTNWSGLDRSCSAILASCEA